MDMLLMIFGNTIVLICLGLWAYSIKEGRNKKVSYFIRGGNMWCADLYYTTQKNARIIDYINKTLISNDSVYRICDAIDARYPNLIWTDIHIGLLSPKNYTLFTKFLKYRAICNGPPCKIYIESIGAFEIDKIQPAEFEEMLKEMGKLMADWGEKHGRFGDRLTVLTVSPEFKDYCGRFLKQTDVTEKLDLVPTELGECFTPSFDKD